MCHRAEIRLDCRATSVREGRRFVADALDRWGVVTDDPAVSVRDDVLLAASELLGNAAKYCAHQVHVTVDGHRDRIEIVVSDDCPGPATRRPAGPDEIGGRGLNIVAAVSSAWGQREFDGTSKEVWCQVAIPEGSVLAVDCHL